MDILINFAVESCPCMHVFQNCLDVTRAACCFMKYSKVIVKVLLKLCSYTVGFAIQLVLLYRYSINGRLGSDLTDFLQ